MRILFDTPGHDAVARVPDGDFTHAFGSDGVTQVRGYGLARARRYGIELRFKS
jgi:hypothetical protein